MSMWFIFGTATIEMMFMKITFLISGNDVISLESRSSDFCVFIHVYSLRPQTYFLSSLTHVLNQL